MIEEAEHFMSEDLTSADDDDRLSERFRQQSWVQDTSSPILRHGSDTSSSSKQPKRYGSLSGSTQQNNRPEGETVGEISAGELSNAAQTHSNADRVLFSWQYYFDG